MKKSEELPESPIANIQRMEAVSGSAVEAQREVTLEAAATRVTETETPTQRAISQWVSKRVNVAGGGSPISRNTEAYNYLMKQLPELASMIDEENKA